MPNFRGFIIFWEIRKGKMINMKQCWRNSNKLKAKWELRYLIFNVESKIDGVNSTLENHYRWQDILHLITNNKFIEPTGIVKKNLGAYDAICSSFCLDIIFKEKIHLEIKINIRCEKIEFGSFKDLILLLYYLPLLIMLKY